MRWIVVIAAMAAKRQRTDAQQCDESALPYDVATYAFTITARDGHAIDARVYAPAAKEMFLRQEPEHGVAFAAYSPLGHISQVEVLGQPKVQAVAARLGRSPAQVAMRWLVQQGIPVVTGTANPAHAKEALDLFGWRLSDKDMRELAAIV